MGFLLAIGDDTTVNSGRNFLHPNAPPRHGQVTRSLQYLELVGLSSNGFRHLKNCTIQTFRDGRRAAVHPFRNLYSGTNALWP
jgi:hypothetical protein